MVVRKCIITVLAGDLFIFSVSYVKVPVKVARAPH